MTSATIVIDVNVFTSAVGQSPAENWNPALADVLLNKKSHGTFSRMALHLLQEDAKNGSGRYQAVSDDHILSHAQYWLSEDVSNNGYGWSPEAALGMIAWSQDLIESTGGTSEFEGVERSNQDLVNLVPDSTWKKAGAEVDHEDRRIVGLAKDSGATVILTNDANFQKLGNRLGYVRVMTPEKFVEEHFGLGK